VLIPTTLACATHTSAVRQRAAAEFHCNESEVDVEDLGASSYRATACGTVATYHCVSTGSSYNPVACAKEEEGPAPARDPAPHGVADDAPVAASRPSSSLCGHAFAKIQDLTAAWSEWYPDRTPKASPSRLEFMSVCEYLSSKQQACLVLPYGRDHRSTCAPLFDMLAPSYRARLDGLFFEAKQN
jgi:hypothetical protein